MIPLLISLGTPFPLWDIKGSWKVKKQKQKPLQKSKLKEI